MDIQHNFYSEKRCCSCLMLSGADDYGEHLFRLFMRVPLA